METALKHNIRKENKKPRPAKKPRPVVTTPSEQDLEFLALANKTFDSLRQQHGTPTVKTTTLLLSPSIPLTGPCWKSFGKHVRSFPGWYPTRHVASSQEKLAAGSWPVSGDAYFVSVTHDPDIVTALALASEGKLPNHERARAFALSDATEYIPSSAHAKRKVKKEKSTAEASKHVDQQEQVALIDISNTQYDSDIDTSDLSP